MENVYELINNRTKKVLENIEFFSGKDSDVDSVMLAKFFGFKVFESKTMNCFDLVSIDGLKKEIVVNDYYNKSEKRVGVVECISYYLLYYNGDELYYTRGINDRGENEYASYFARNILMPIENFSRMYELLSEQLEYFSVIRALKAIYDVPSDVVVKRISDMNMLKEQEKTK